MTEYFQILGQEIYKIFIFGHTNFSFSSNDSVAR